MLEDEIITKVAKPLSITREEAIDIITKVANRACVTEKEAVVIITKAKEGGELSSEDFDKWFSKRFAPNLVLIDQAGYTKMCVNALKTVATTAATDYGSSRQRDFGQIWADITRGYLGEYAFKLLLKRRWGIDISLNHEEGDIEEFLPSDIHRVVINGEEREPKIKLSIKTTKWNGIWLDIPGDQFNHSDAFVFVKIGVGRDHLFAFFKHISVFKDKILREGIKKGELTEEEAKKLFEGLPSFSDIPAYIAGFALKKTKYKDLPYGGKMGRKHYTIHSWKGPILPGNLERIKERENVSGSGEVSFLNIGEFAHKKGCLFNTGNLLWKKGDWRKLTSSL